MDQATIAQRSVVNMLGALACLMPAACNSAPRVSLRYELQNGLAPADITRVETQVAVAPGDPRSFTADLPYRAVDTGVGYEVRDFDGTGQRTLLITHDASLGYNFDLAFVFTLLPPIGDAPPLEIRARAFGAGVSQVLADSGVVAAMFGKNAEAKLPLADQRCGGVSSCTGNEVCCDAVCTDVDQDVANCSGCGMACGGAGDECSGSACRCNGGSGCGAGKACCPGLGCVDTGTDAFNCGSCGKACAPGESCNGGTCRCGTTTCAAGQNCCDGVCTSGGCSCGASTCSVATPLCCGGGCVDTTTDNANCGTCGTVCVGAFQCAGGACRCNGTSLCTGLDTCCDGGCKSLDTDPANCGACGNACNDGETCAGGHCRCGTGDGCNASKLCCADGPAAPRKCIDPLINANNCGTCGTICAGAQQCVGGMCQCPGVGMACSAGTQCCPMDGCYDFSSDSNHCGNCNTTCGPSESCMGGVCRSTTVVCMPSCTNGTTCDQSNGQCYCGTVQTGCTNMMLGELCCASNPNGCVDTVSDPLNCGGCNISCAAQSKDACCSSACVNFDANHCGDCTTKCKGLTPNCVLCNGMYTCRSAFFICLNPPP